MWVWAVWRHRLHTGWSELLSSSSRHRTPQRSRGRCSTAHHHTAAICKWPWNVQQNVVGSRITTYRTVIVGERNTTSMSFSVYWPHSHVRCNMGWVDKLPIRYTQYQTCITGEDVEFQGVFQVLHAITLAIRWKAYQFLHLWKRTCVSRVDR